MRFSTHFVVVSVKKDSLLKFGVLRSSKATIQESLSKDNIDFPKLREFAQFLASAAGVPESTPFAADHGVNIFDFSCKGRLTNPYFACTSSSGEANGPLVLPVGDALINPFWPHGLGVNRGFHSALDAVWAIFLDCTSSRQEATRERIVAHNMLTWYLPLLSFLDLRFPIYFVVLFQVPLASTADPFGCRLAHGSLDSL